MPADVAEDSLDLMIELLEAVEPNAASYPFPRLRRSNRFERRTFRAIVLENPHFRATVVPDLGGRIVRWEDKRAGSDLWSFEPRVDVREGGVRGVDWPGGLQIRTGFGDRLNSMGTVASAPDYAEEADSPSGIWLGEVCGDGVSIHWRLNAPENAPYLELEVRAFNRSLHAVPYNGGIALPGGAWHRSGGSWIWRSENGTLLVECPYLSYAEGGALHRFNRMRYLSPRQLDSWTAKIYPSGVGKSLRAANSSLHVGWNREEMRIQGVEGIPGGKVVVLTAAQQTLELPVEISPQGLNLIPLSSLPDEIVELVVMDADRNERIRAGAANEFGQPGRAQDEPEPATLDPNATLNELMEAEFDVSQRHLAHVLAGNLKLSAGDFRGAANSFEQGLLFNAEDHLAWWAKAAAERKAGSEETDRPELLNAHFLAPLEPVLRAEGFLASPTHTRDKSAVLSPLEETPEAFLEVACLLLESNLYQDAARWIAESLLHVELPLLRYLLAYVYLELGGMDVDAAEQVQLAVREKPEPPYPWRRVEMHALAMVAERFPADGSLRRLVELTERARLPQ